MRGVLSWVAGGVLAFLLTAGSFLLLASLATGPPESSLPTRTAPERSGSSLELWFDQDELAALPAAEDQRLSVTVVNEGTEPLEEVNVTLKASSEDTSLASARYHRATIESLAPAESATVEFRLDLPSPETTSPAEAPRAVLEVRASTPRGVSAVRTAILPPPSGPARGR